MNWALKFYLTFRRPRNFLIVVCAYIASAIVAHFFFGYDRDWGSTNLTFSIEATIASAVILMVQEDSSRIINQMMERILALEEAILASEERILEVLTNRDER